MSIRHDYKSATITQRRQRARRYGLLVMTLVLIGLFGGLLAYIKGDRAQSAPTAAVIAPRVPDQPSAPAAPLKPVVAPLAESEPVKPKYDFYTELPKRQISVHREILKPGNTSQPAPARIPPVANPLHKPTSPRGNVKNPTLTMTAVGGGAKPDSKSTNSKSTNSKSTNSKSTNSESTNSKTANSKTANSKTANSTSTNSKTANSTPTNSRPATAKPANSEPTNSKSTPTTSRPVIAKPVAPTPATSPARTAQPIRPLANNSPNVFVKTE